MAVEETSKKSMEQSAYEKLKDAILMRMLAAGTQLLSSEEDMLSIDKLLRSHIAKSLSSLQIEKIVYKSIDDVFDTGAY